MAFRVTVETASRSEAELIAQQLPEGARVQSWRGLGVIRLALKSSKDLGDVLEAVAHGFHEHELKWARVRYGDEEQVFKGSRRRSD